LTEGEVRAIYERGKGQETDFKPESTTPAKLAESLTALANSAGGTVLLGVGSKSAKLVGLKDPEAAQDKALKAALLADPPLIIPLPEVVNLDGAEILVITVPPGLPHVYNLKGRYLMRDGPRDKPMTSPQVRQLMMERGEVSFESLTTPGATLEDVDWEKVERYLVPLENVPGQTAREALYKRGCLAKKGNRYRPTNAGLLLFGQDLERFFRSNEIIVVRYAGREMGDEFLREDIRDTLPEQIRRAESFLVSNMSKGVRLVRLEREERTEYPVEAVREAIVNAVAHRDYSIRGEGIRVLMFSDRIEFYSPGRLPGHVTLNNIVQERFSRNEVIVQILADMGFIERLGYGIDRMIQLMLDHGLPDPVFQETANGFQVTLYGHGESLISDEVDARHWRHLHLNERQEKALAYLAERGRITNREYQELCSDVSAETIRRDLADLVDKNLVLKIGDKRATYYIFK
jgi:ATP-dependent DNA helicase RecG